MKFKVCLCSLELRRLLIFVWFTETHPDIYSSSLILY
ncbi:unnamed protein product [Brassica rapa subsp. narinosa]